MERDFKSLEQELDQIASNWAYEIEKETGQPLDEIPEAELLSKMAKLLEDLRA